MLQNISLTEETTFQFYFKIAVLPTACPYKMNNKKSLHYVLFQDCMYLHELGEEQASFTKEEMQQGKHQEYEQKLYEQFMNSQNLANGPTPPITTTVPSLLSQNPIPSPSLNTAAVTNLGPHPSKSNQRCVLVAVGVLRNTNVMKGTCKLK